MLATFSGRAAAVDASNLEKAQKIFERLLEKTPDDPDIYRYLGDIYAAKGNKKEARRFYEEYARRRPSDYYPHYKLGEMAWADKDEKAAKAHFSKALSLIEGAKKDASSEMSEARMLALSGETKRSDEIFSQLIAADPNNKDIANLHLETLLDTKRSQPALKEARAYSEKYPESYQFKRTLARAEAAEGNYARAEKIYEGLMADRPADDALKGDYAYLEFEKGDWKEAMSYLDDLTARYPDNTDYQTTYDELYRAHRPRLKWGFDMRLIGGDQRYGPYADYLYPLNETWAFGAAYQLYYYDANVPNYDPDYTVFSNVVAFRAYYSPFNKFTVVPGFANQLVGSDYAPYPFLYFDYNDPDLGLFHAGYGYNKVLDDPESALYFGGRRDQATFTYDNTFIERIVFTARYESNWYRVNGSKTGLNMGNDFGREDVAEGGLHFIVLKRPQIQLGYDFLYSQLHIVNNYLNIIPLIQEQMRSSIMFGFYNEWDDWIITDLGAFWGADPKRDLSFTSMDLYGFQAALRFRISKQFEVGGHYEYSSEDLFNTSGRYQLFGVDFVYRF